MEKIPNWQSLQPLFLKKKSQQIRKGIAEAFSCWRKYPFLMGNRSFHSLIPPATQWCTPHNSTPEEAGKGNDISLNPWRWIKKKATQSFPHSLWAVTAMCLHQWNKAGAVEEFTAPRELISILQESEAYRKYCGEHNSNTGEEKSVFLDL